MKNMEVDPGCELDAIKHDGIVTKIDAATTYVTIVTHSACNACTVKGACNVSEMNEEVVEVPRKGEPAHQVGDRVQLVMKKTLGTRAVLLGYFFPFLVLLFTLIIMLSVTSNEGLAGLVSLAVLIPYYMILYLLRDRLKKTFTFNIQ